MDKRKSVIAVGMLDSIHFARWLELFSNEPIDFLLFPSSPNRRVHSLIRTLIEGRSEASYVVPYSLERIAPLLWIVDKILGNFVRGTILRRLVNSHNPDFVHTLEMQNAGYMARVAWKKLSPEAAPRLVVTNYGSDIYWFGRKSRHRRKIEELLGYATSYSAECERDVVLAERFGFTGNVLPVFLAVSTAIY